MGSWRPIDERAPSRSKEWPLLPRGGGGGGRGSTPFGGTVCDVGGITTNIICGGLGPFPLADRYPYFFPDFLGRSTAWMFGRTPPEAIVTVERSLESSSSFRTASWTWRGTMRLFLLSRAALPASSSTSALRYSRTAARYTGAPAPTRVAYLPCFRYRLMRPTGNCSPALADREVPFPAPFPFPFPRPDIVACRSLSALPLPALPLPLCFLPM